MTRRPFALRAKPRSLEDAGVGTARAWLAMQSAHDLAAERAVGIPKAQPLQPVASTLTTPSSRRYAATPGDPGSVRNCRMSDVSPSRSPVLSGPAPRLLVRIVMRLQFRAARGMHLHSLTWATDDAEHLMDASPQ